MPISDDDLNYLRNINTRPGPNAGKSIDPTKPGPSDKTDKWDREHVKPMIKSVTDTMVNVAYEAYWDAPDDADDHASMRIALEAALAQSDAHGELIPDCPTNGVAARQGNGG